MRRHDLPTISTAAALLAIASCGGGGSSGGRQTNDLGANVHGQVFVESPSITIELSAPGIRSAALTAPYSKAATAFDGRFYLLALVLPPGASELEMEAEMTDGSTRQQRLHVEIAEMPDVAVALRAEPSTCRPSEAVSLSVEAFAVLGSPTEMLVDFDGDGVLDQRKPYEAQLSLTPNHAGSFVPSVTLRTSNGHLFTGTTIVTCIEGSGLADVGVALDGLNGVSDIERDPRSARWFALHPPSTSLRGFTESGASAGAIPIPFALAPSGFTCAENGNIFVVDTALDGVLALNAADRYALDPLFGRSGVAGHAGTQLGEFVDPSDVVTLGRTAGTDLRVIVSDSGNDRLQILRGDGSPLKQVLGTENGGPRFIAPGQLTRVGSSGFAVIDVGNALVRVFDVDGNERYRWGASDAATIGERVPVSLAWSATDGSLYIGEIQEPVIRVRSIDGRLLRTFTLSSPATAIATWSGSNGQRIALAGTGSVTLSNLVEDPPSGAPENVVERVVGALRANQLALVGDSLDPGLAERLESILADPDAAALLLNALDEVAGAVVVERIGSYVVVDTPVASDPSRSPIEWTLRRASGTGRWLVLDVQ